MMSGLTKRLQPSVGILYLMLTLSFASSAFPQGILTVTPGRSVATTTGTGTLGYSGDNSTAASATLANPSAVAYDAGGNLYLADALNHVVREVLKSGQITTIAGTGVEGYGGDNGAATTAYLDTPRGAALDGHGNVSIGNAHTHGIRKGGSGRLTTIG